MTTMTTMEVGQKLVDLCRQGQHHTAFETLYSPDVISVEAAAMPGIGAEARGLPAVLAKGQWWSETHTVHSEVLDGPYPHGDRFIVKFTYDVTNKPSSRRYEFHEMALYTVENGKVAREEFFYTPS